MRRTRKHDVVAKRQLEKQETKAIADKTFKQAAVAFIEPHARQNIRRWTEQVRFFGRHPESDELKVMPRGLVDRRGRPLSEINGNDIRDIADETRVCSALGPERRRKGKSDARAMFSMLWKSGQTMLWRLLRQTAGAPRCIHVTCRATM